MVPILVFYILLSASTVDDFNNSNKTKLLNDSFHKDPFNYDYEGACEVK